MTKAGFELLVPGPGDAKELASVHVRAWQEAYGDLLPRRFFDDDARARRHEMWSGLLCNENDRERVRVAAAPGQILGFTLRGPAEPHAGHPPTRDEQLFALYVLRSWYGSGAGQALLDECLGGRPAQLWVAKENTRARRFYEKNGFIYDGTEHADRQLEGLVEVRMLR